MYIIKSPFRISLFGGGSDLPVYFKKNGGEVIAIELVEGFSTTSILNKLKK